MSHWKIHNNVYLSPYIIVSKPYHNSFHFKLHFNSKCGRLIFLACLYWIATLMEKLYMNRSLGYIPNDPRQNESEKNYVASSICEYLHFIGKAYSWFSLTPKLLGYKYANILYIKTKSWIYTVLNCLLAVCERPRGNVEDGNSIRKKLAKTLPRIIIMALFILIFILIFFLKRRGYGCIHCICYLRL